MKSKIGQTISVVMIPVLLLAIDSGSCGSDVSADSAADVEPLAIFT